MLLKHMLGVVGMGIAEGGKDGWIEEKIRDQGRESKGGLHLLLKGLKDIKSFWESDYSIQRKKLKLCCIDGMVCSYLPNLERAGFICVTLSASAMQVINMTE